MYFDKRMLYAIMAIMFIMGLRSYLTDTYALLGLLYSIPGVLIAITFHEFAHAKVADMLGDDTPRHEGRLTLNPLAHIDPVGFMLLLFAGFGWGKPVRVNPRNYNREMTMEKADCLVSLAGPIMNFLLAIIFAIIYSVTDKFAEIFVESQIGSIIMGMMMYTIILNIGLGVFNLIPLPPLDGSKVIKPLLPYNAKRWFEENERIFYIIFIIIWLTKIAGKIILPINLFIYDLLMNLLDLII